MASTPTPRKGKSTTPSGTDAHAITRWINAKLSNRNMRLVGKLVDGLKSGVLLYHLLEELSGDSLAEEVGKLSKGSTRHHHLSNVSICLRYLESVRVPLVNIGAIDVVDGNESSVLGLLWRIKQHFFAAADYIDDTIDDEDNNNISADVNMSPAKQQCLAWLKHRVQGVIDPATGNSLANSVHDVTEGVANGAVLLAVLHNFVTTAANTAGGGASADPAAEEEVDTSVAPAPTGDPAVDFATDHAPKRSCKSPPRGPFTMFPGSPTSYPASKTTAPARPLPALPPPLSQDGAELQSTSSPQLLPPLPVESRASSDSPTNRATDDAAATAGNDATHEAAASNDADERPSRLSAALNSMEKSPNEEQFSEMGIVPQEYDEPQKEKDLSEHISAATAAPDLAPVATAGADINDDDIDIDLPTKGYHDVENGENVINVNNGAIKGAQNEVTNELATAESNAPDVTAAQPPPSMIVPPSYGSPRGEGSNHLVEELPGSPCSCMSADLLASPLVSGLLVVASCVNNASPSNKSSNHGHGHHHNRDPASSSAARKPSRKLNWRPDLPVYEWKRVAFADDDCMQVKSLDLARCNLQLDLADLPALAALAPDGPVEVLRLSHNPGLTGDLRTLVQSAAPAPILELSAPPDQYQEVGEAGDNVKKSTKEAASGEDEGADYSRALLQDNSNAPQDLPGGEFCPTTPSLADTGGGLEEALGSTVGATGDAVRPHKSPHKSPLKSSASPVPISPSAVSSLSSNSVSGEEEGGDDLDGQDAGDVCNRNGSVVSSVLRQNIRDSYNGFSVNLGGAAEGGEDEEQGEVNSEILTESIASSSVVDGSSPPCALQVLWLNGTSIGGSLRHLARAHFLRHCYLGSSTAAAGTAPASGAAFPRRHSRKEGGLRGNVGVFAHCPALVRLSLANCGPRVTGDFAPVARACFNLEDLELHGTNVNVDLVACFGRCDLSTTRPHGSSCKRDGNSSSGGSRHRSSRGGRRLRRLSVSGPLVSGDVVAGLGGCYRLEDLRLPHTHCSGDLTHAVAEMAAMQHRAAGLPARSRKNGSTAAANAAALASSPYSPAISSGARCRLTWLNVVGSSQLAAFKAELLQLSALDCSIFGAS